MIRQWSSDCRAEGELVTKGPELANEVTSLAVGVDPSLVEVRAEVDEESARVRQQVPDDDEDGALDRDERLQLAGPLHEPSVRGTEEGVGPDGSSRGLAEDAFLGRGCPCRSSRPGSSTRTGPFPLGAARRFETPSLVLASAFCWALGTQSREGAMHVVVAGTGH